MALGFNIPSELLVPVQYTTTRPKVRFDLVKKQVINGAAVTDRIIRTKFIDWHYEQEYRLFIDLSPEDARSPLVFSDFSSEIKLEQVILGMRCNLSISMIRELLSSELPSNRIIKAGMAHRSFKVTEDRTYR